MIDTYGEPLADGTVVLAASQAELSERCGYARNDGRVYAWLRDLGDAVVTRHGGVVVDPARLAVLERSIVVRPLTARTVAVGEQLHAAFARPAADGTTVFCADGPSGWRPPTLADMAATLGVNRSSAHRHLRALRSAEGGGPAGSCPHCGNESLDQRVELLEALVVAQAEVIAATTRVAELTAELTALHTSANPRNVRAGFSADRAADVADQEIQDEMREEKILLFSHLSSASSADCAPRSPRTAENISAEPPAGDWDADELEGLLAELRRACDDMGRPGPSSRPGLLSALRPHPATAVREAACRVAAQVRAGKVTSPYGLLVAAARPDHPSHRLYFPPATPPAAESAEPESTVDTEAIAAVTALQASGDTAALDDLDSLVAAAHAATPGLHATFRRLPQALLAARAEAWRSRHPAPASIGRQTSAEGVGR